MSQQKVLVLLHGVFKRAKRRKWIATNPAEDVERVSVRRSGDFNVLSPVQVEAVARAAESEQDAALFTVAAFAGLRLGELRGLRWADVDFAVARRFESCPAHLETAASKRRTPDLRLASRRPAEVGWTRDTSRNSFGCVPRREGCW